MPGPTKLHLATVAEVRQFADPTPSVFASGSTPSDCSPASRAAPAGVIWITWPLLVRRAAGRPNPEPFPAGPDVGGANNSRNAGGSEAAAFKGNPPGAQRRPLVKPGRGPPGITSLLGLPRDKLG